MRFANKPIIWIKDKKLVLDYINDYYSIEEFIQIIKKNNGIEISGDYLKEFEKRFSYSYRTKQMVIIGSEILIDIKTTGAFNIQDGRMVDERGLYFICGNRYLHLSNYTSSYSTRSFDYKMPLIFLK